MRWRKEKISIPSLLIASGITILFMVLEFNSASKVQAPFFKEKISAARLTQKAFLEIKDFVKELNIPIDSINDPNKTGLIGLQYSSITSGRADLNEKLTTTNPNIAALVVELLRTSGVKKYDTVAVSLTGSYPALNIAIMCAIKILKLHPIIITSLSASMWGANHPNLTYLDMETRLNKKRVFEFKSAAASLGGNDDMGRGLSPLGRKILLSVMEKNNIPCLDSKNPADAIEKRWQIYTGVSHPRLFINVGEANYLGPDIEPGYIPPGKLRYGKGLAVRFSRAGIGVINLVRINNLAKKYDLPIAPIPLPKIGTGKLFCQIRYSTTRAIIYTLILILALILILRIDFNYYPGLRKRIKHYKNNIDLMHHWSDKND